MKKERRTKDKVGRPGPLTKKERKLRKQHRQEKEPEEPNEAREAWRALRTINRFIFYSINHLFRMIKKIDHIGIVTNNYRETVIFFKSLGLKPKELEIQNMKFALIPVGDDEIEIIEGDQEGYHIALQVDEIEQAIEKLKEKGIKMIDEKPWVGVHGYKIAFTDPESTKGISIELCEH